jgi:hypothetical protein
MKEPICQFNFGPLNWLWCNHFITEFVCVLDGIAPLFLVECHHMLKGGTYISSSKVWALEVSSVQEVVEHILEYMHRIEEKEDARSFLPGS